MTNEQNAEAQRRQRETMANQVIRDAAARRASGRNLNTGLIVATFIVIVCMMAFNYRAMLNVKTARRELAAAIVERDHQREVAAAWKQKDDANYPLARQWRMAYEDLQQKCMVIDGVEMKPQHLFPPRPVKKP